MINREIVSVLKKKLWPLLAAGFLCHPLNAQKPTTQRKDAVPLVKPSYYHDHDTTYYRSFERYITARFYLSQKYAGIGLQRPAGVSSFHYRPDISFAAGVGVTYQSISINLGYAFNFLNDIKAKGKTSYLDLQGHIYGRHWTFDVLGQLYKGYYLTPKGLAHTDGSYYVRPDMRLQLLGLSGYRTLNSKKFSFRSALLENETQLKSAGSILVGAEVYYGVIKGDSSIVPLTLSQDYPQKDVRRLDFFKIGPGIGYAYTFVFAPNYYLTGALCASLSADFSNQHGASDKASNFNINKGFIYRVAVGHDQNDWNVNLSLVGNQMTIRGSTTNNKYLLSAGNFRLTVAKRLKPSRGLSKKLHPVDKVIEDIKGLKPGNQ